PYSHTWGKSKTVDTVDGLQEESTIPCPIEIQGIVARRMKRNRLRHNGRISYENSWTLALQELLNQFFSRFRAIFRNANGFVNGVIGGWYSAVYLKDGNS